MRVPFACRLTRAVRLDWALAYLTHNLMKLFASHVKPKDCHDRVKEAGKERLLRT